MGQAIQPLVDAIAKVIVKILGWVIKLFGYINAISISLFGYDIFTSATVDNFKKTNKEANKLKRTLAGFDEINMLNDNRTTGALGGIVANLPDIANKTQKELKWLNKLENKFEEVKKIFLKFGN